MFYMVANLLFCKAYESYRKNGKLDVFKINSYE